MVPRMSEGTSASTPGCPRCAELEKRIAELELLVRKLQEQLNLNSSYSSIPPSANPLNAPKPVNKRLTGRKPGGQTGHPGHFRRRLLPSSDSEPVSSELTEPPVRAHELP